MTARPLTLEAGGDIARLYLDRPPRNEMDRAFFDSFVELVAVRLPALGCRGLVVTGRGRHFSSGAKLDDPSGIVFHSNLTPDNGGQVCLECLRHVAVNWPEAFHWMER